DDAAGLLIGDDQRAGAATGGTRAELGVLGRRIGGASVSLGGATAGVCGGVRRRRGRGGDGSTRNCRGRRWTGTGTGTGTGLGRSRSARAGFRTGARAWTGTRARTGTRAWTGARSSRSSLRDGRRRRT